jgi:hypothetical protein
MADGDTVVGDFERVGKIVGIDEGDAVGMPVGKGVGFADGFFVGLAVGICVFSP